MILQRHTPKNTWHNNKQTQNEIYHKYKIMQIQLEKKKGHLILTPLTAFTMWSALLYKVEQLFPKH